MLALVVIIENAARLQISPRVGFRRASKLLSKHFSIDAKYNRVEELIDSNLKDISKYILDILEKIDSNPNSAINERNNCI